MRYRKLGKTGLMVSEIGFGGEWLERHEEEESVALMRYAHSQGINIVDCWMPDPKSRDIIGKAMEGCRGEWIVQGHIGSTWQNGQYVRTRYMKYVVPAFEDILEGMHTDYMDLGIPILRHIRSAGRFMNWKRRCRTVARWHSCTGSTMSSFPMEGWRTHS